MHLLQISHKQFRKDGTPSNDNGRVAKLEQYNGTERQIHREFSHIKYGGDGSDALSISSGTTTVDLGGARVYILNYSSISITGTGKLVSQTHTQTERWSSSSVQAIVNSRLLPRL